MRLDRDYLMEMELWSHFQLRPKNVVAPVAMVETAAAAQPLPMEATRVKAPPAQPTRPAAPMSAAAPRTLAKTVAPAAPPAMMDAALKARVNDADWAGLIEIASTCQVCGLCKQRKNVVVGVGANAGPWLFIGEGPGAEEDESGEPFVGQAGKLLDAMLTAAGLQRGREVYIANVVKCRPPGNRTPTPEEAAACAPYLDRQIDLVAPKIIVALGKTAIARMTGSDAAMAALRGRVHRYRNIPVIATYHPAYLLRNLPDKLKAWEDLQLARKTFAGVL
jgi:uracil-DNA glycosylase